MTEQIDYRALFKLSYGLYIITSRDGERINGLIANTVFQVTAVPPRVAVAIEKKCLTSEMMGKSGVFAVCVLDEATPLKFIGIFGFNSGRNFDKFSHACFRPGITGCPIVTENVLSYLEARVVDSLEVDTHTVFIGEVVSAENLRGGRPLTYSFYHEHLKGKTPRSAPTYRPAGGEREKSERGGRMKKYICNVCGYVYDPEAGDSDSGIDPGTPFEKLPENWVCPVCGAGKDQFTPEG